MNAKSHLNDFDNILKVNDYPNKFIENHKTFPDQSNSRGEKEASDYSYLNFPYITDVINRKIVKCFRREGLPVRLYHKTYSLRNALSKKNNNNKTCNKRAVL